MSYSNVPPYSGYYSNSFREFPNLSYNFNDHLQTDLGWNTYQNFSRNTQYGGNQFQRHNPYIPPNPPLPTFHGIPWQDPCSHIKKIEDICVYEYNYDLQRDTRTHELFLSTLKDKAKCWETSLILGSYKTWCQLKNKFLNEFYPPHEEYLETPIRICVNRPSPTMKPIT